MMISNVDRLKFVRENNKTTIQSEYLTFSSLKNIMFYFIINKFKAQDNLEKFLYKIYHLYLNISDHQQYLSHKLQER